MANGNETALRHCRFLNDDYFQELYDTFIVAFSDYVVPFALTETQFRNHIILTAVDLERTAGCIQANKLVGFSLNGFGHWEGRRTVYDAGTGVIPDHRRQGISMEMFALMLPVFKDAGFEQYLLEVVTTNAGAIDLYAKLGFNVARELALLQCDGELTTSIHEPPNIDIRDIDEADWDLLLSFWDGTPSWQNSLDSVNRSRKMKKFFGAFRGGKCVGYIVFSSKFGRVAQLAVSSDHRNRGIGTALLRSMQTEMADGFSMQVINIDKSITSAMNFFLNRGFFERLSQHEMVKMM
ncbi:MAG: GNAT family N-acetyltransferase [Pyrinomonadaceae bacterium]